MASLKFGRATGTITDTGFLRLVALSVVGYIASVSLTGLMRDNVMDIGMAGGDAIYSVISAAVFLMLPIGQRNARFLALGALFGGSLTLYQELLS